MKRTLFVTAVTVPLVASPAVADAPSLEAIYNEVWARAVQVSIARGQDEVFLREMVLIRLCGFAAPETAESSEVLKQVEEVKFIVIKNVYASMYSDGFESLSAQDMHSRVLPVVYALQRGYQDGYSTGFQYAMTVLLNLDNNYKEIVCRSARERSNERVEDAEALLEELQRLGEAQD